MTHIVLKLMALKQSLGMPSSQRSVEQSINREKIKGLARIKLVSRICLIDQLSFVGCISDSVMHHSYFYHDFIVFGV